MPISSHPSARTINIVNKSTLMDDYRVQAAAIGCDQQMIQHIAPAWERAPWHVVFLGKNQAASPGSLVIEIRDTPDEPDALGYHSETAQGILFGRIFVKPVLDEGGVFLFDPTNPKNVSVSSVLSHEVAETFVDPFVNSWVDGPAIPEGTSYAMEVCDPVQGDSYELNVLAGGGKIAQVSVSNFVFPEWFDVSAPQGTRCDQMRTVRTPFTMSSGGYMVVRHAPGTETQVFGERFNPTSKRNSRLSRRVTR